MYKILDNLYQGPRPTQEVLDEYGIKVVVNVSELHLVFDRVYSTVHVKMLDGDVIGAERLAFVVGALRLSLVLKLPTLVCCHAGMSRSVMIVAAYLILHEGLSYEQAMDTIGNINGTIFPHERYKNLLRQLAEKGDAFLRRFS